MQRTTTRAAWYTLAAAMLFLAACGGGPSPESTPEGQYKFAKEAIAGKNYVKALDTLEQVIKRGPDSDLAVRANLTRAALLAGMSEAYKRMAEAYMEGYKSPSARAYSSQMRKMAMDYYGMGRVRSVEYVEGFDRTAKHIQAEKTLTFDLPMPQTIGREATALEQVRHGKLLSDEERVKIEYEEVEAGLARAIAQMLGVGEDLNAARARLQGGSATVNPTGMLVAAGQRMCLLSAIFRPRALDDQRLDRAFHERALATVDSALERLKKEPDKKLEESAKKVKQECQKALKGG